MENRKGALISFPNRQSGNRRRQFRRGPRSAPVVSDKDLNTQRVGGPTHPPQHTGNTVITRKTRFTIPYNATAIAQNYTAASILANDALEYLGATSPLRFSAGFRVIKAEAWFGIINEPTTGSYPNLFLLDAVSNNGFTDSPNGGVDWAHVAIRPCLYARMVERPVADTTSLIGLEVAAAEGCSGTIILDVTYAAQ